MPSFYDYDAEGIEMNEGFEPVPSGDYLLLIESVEEKISKKGDPLFNIKCEISGGEFAGRKIWHNVTLMGKGEDGKPKKGAGMALHFLKSIGEPYEGKIKVVPDNWIEKFFMATLGIEEGFNGRDRNFIAKLWAYEGEPPVKKDRSVNEEEVPF